MLLKCTACQYVYYCGKVCQKEGWSIHKAECKSLKKIAPRIIPDAARMLARMVRRLSKNGNQVRSYYTEMNFRMYKDLMSRKLDQIPFTEVLYRVFCRLSGYEKRHEENGAFSESLRRSKRVYEWRNSPKSGRSHGYVRQGEYLKRRVIVVFIKIDFLYSRCASTVLIYATKSRKFWVPASTQGLQCWTILVNQTLQQLLKVPLFTCGP